MSWENINLNDVKVLDEKAPAPAGRYTLQLVGAYANKRNEADTDILFKIADNGDYQGKSVYVDLPDPEKPNCGWSVDLAARIFTALGVKPEAFGNPREQFNRVAQNGHSRLMADVYVREFTRSDGTAGSQNKVNSRSFGPAA